MNEPNELAAEQLKLATSRSLPTGESLDSETAALRDGWLALGRVVEAGNAGFSEDALLARLAKSNERTAAVSLPTRPAPAASSLWPILLGTALAIAMLFAVVRTLSVGTTENNVVTTPDRPVENPPEIVVPHALVDDGTTTPEQPAPETTNEPAAIAAWSDPLDDQIDQALAQLRSTTDRRGSVDDSLTTLQQQLQQLSADMADGSL